MTMTVVILVLLALYVLGTVLLGAWAHRRALDDSEDYFIAKRSLSWVHLGLTLFATWMSTFAFLGSPGFYYKNGVKWFLPHAFLVVGSPLLLWFIGRKIWRLGRERGYITPADLLADFYDSNAVRYLVAAISMLALVPYCLIQLVGIGKVLEASIPGSASYALGIGIAVLGITAYTYLGGIRAIVLTDVVQGILFGILMLVGAGVALYAAGGVKAGFEASVALRPDAFLFDPGTVGSPLTLLVIWTFGYILLPHMWQRAYMAKSAEAFSKSIVLGSILALTLIALPSLLMGTLGIGFMPGLEDPDKFVPLMYAQYFEWGLPLLVLATFAAGMSTVDSQLLSAASVVVRDVVRPLSGKQLNPANERRLGRLVVIALITILTVLAFLPQAQGSIILLASKGTGIALLLMVPLCGPLFWDRASKVGAIASLAIGGVVLFTLESKLIKIPIPFNFGPPIVAFVCQAPIFVIGSLLAPKYKNGIGISDSPKNEE